MKIFVTLASYPEGQRSNAKIARLRKKIAKLRQQGLTRHNRPAYKALQKLIKDY